MNTNVASLDRLHDIIVPAPVSWWPPAPGWDWVIGFLLLLAVAIALKGFIRWQHNRYRREALAELMRVKSRLKKSNERSAALLALSELLKRTALTAFPREQVATLTGKDWFAFLDRTGAKTAFGNGLGALLENAIYDPRTATALDEQKLEELGTVARHWIRGHKTNLEQKDAKITKQQPTDELSLPSLSSLKIDS